MKTQIEQIKGAKFAYIVEISRAKSGMMRRYAVYLQPGRERGVEIPLPGVKTAAPELLAALERLLAAYKADVDKAPGMSVRVSWETNLQAIGEAMEAIAKAKGQP